MEDTKVVTNEAQPKTTETALKKLQINVRKLDKLEATLGRGTGFNVYTS